MPQDEQLEQVHAIADRVARGYGLKIFDLQLRREAIGWVLRIVIDRPALAGSSADAGPSMEESIGIEDCQRVSHDVSAILDVEDLVHQHYTLEVSSPGLDRPLRGVDDYRRFAGRCAKLVVSVAVDGQKSVTGRLRGMDGARVLLEVDHGRMHRIPVTTITRAQLEVEF